MQELQQIEKKETLVRSDLFTKVQLPRNLRLHLHWGSVYISIEAGKRNTYFLSNVASRNPKVTKVS